MKAPDKIYVTIDRPAEKVLYNPELVGVAWSKKDKSCEHIEYIRKDALLEWAREKYNEYKLMDEDFQGDVFIGNRLTFAEVIAKIESL